VYRAHFESCHLRAKREIREIERFSHTITLRHESPARASLSPTTSPETARSFCGVAIILKPTTRCEVEPTLRSGQETRADHRRMIASRRDARYVDRCARPMINIAREFFRFRSRCEETNRRTRSALLEWIDDSARRREGGGCRDHSVIDAPRWLRGVKSNTCGTRRLYGSVGGGRARGRGDSGSIRYGGGAQTFVTYERTLMGICSHRRY